MLRKVLVGIGSMLFLFLGFNAAGVSEGKVKRGDLLFYVVSPTSSLKILPTDRDIPGSVSNEILLAASPGEYEPASFVIRSVTDIASLEIKASTLKGKGGIIPSSNIDIKIVKCWYQSGEGIVNEGKRIFTPELLLNDDSLVKVDTKNKENYVKANYPEGERYVCISKKNDPFLQYGKGERIPIEALPVKDSPVLLPIDIPAGTNKQIWITVKVPEDAKSGIYTSKINLSNAKETLGNLTLKLKVLPIELSQPYYASSIYYHGCLHPNWLKGSISCRYKSKKQLRAELKDMFIHGVTNPTCYQGFYQQDFDEKLLGEYLKIRNEVGIGGLPLYTLGLIGPSFNPTAPADLKVLKDRVKKVIKLAKSYGISEVYFYGKDEVKGKELMSQRPAWEAIHEAGGKIYVAGYKDSNFLLMGDIQDLLVCAGYPSKQEVAKWHAVGHKIWCYANPQAGIENPEIYRRNFGLLLWKHNYDGAATFIYMSSFGNSWNDFDHFWREHSFVYPTVDGVIDTIAWEGYREGVDDVRYLTTLLQAIEKNRNSSDTKIRRIVAQAEKYLEDLDISRNLNAIRLEMINYILKLTGGK